MTASQKYVEVIERIGFCSHLIFAADD